MRRYSPAAGSPTLPATGFFVGRVMHIHSRRAQDRVKAVLLHGGSKIKVTIRSVAEWRLLRDRLDDAVADALEGSAVARRSDDDFTEFCEPPGPLHLTCDLSAVTCEDEFEQRAETIHRVMSRQHPADVRLTVLVSPELRNRFDSVEWKHREACAAAHHTCLTPVGVAQTKG